MRRPGGRAALRAAPSPQGLLLASTPKKFLRIRVESPRSPFVITAPSDKPIQCTVTNEKPPSSWGFEAFPPIHSHAVYIYGHVTYRRVTRIQQV